MTTASSAENDGAAANAKIATPSAAAYSDGRLKERRVMELPLDVLSDRRAWTAARVRRIGSRPTCQDTRVNGGPLRPCTHECVSFYGVIPGRLAEANPESRDSGFDADASPRNDPRSFTGSCGRGCNNVPIGSVS